MSDRLDRPCMLVASGRLALYIALRTLLRPGDRILMSPVNDDVIFFTVLAAGLRPVMAPVSREDGNIEPRLVGNEVWLSVAGVLTTNLYGLPDRVQALRAQCDRFGIALIEDAAHAIESDVNGRPIGTFGDAAAFSLSKHVGAAAGGVLAFEEESDRLQFERLRDATTIAGRTRDHLARFGADATERLVIATHLVWPVRWLRRKLRAVERVSFRMPLRAGHLRQAIAGGAGLAAFDPWVRVDRHAYRVLPSRLLLEQALRNLRRLDLDRARRVEGVERLRTLPIAAPAARDGDPQPLFRVPLLVDDRHAMIGRAERRLHGVGYIYDPPLDDYAGREFAEEASTPEAARWWTSRVLPVDPLEADRFLRSCGTALRPRAARPA